MEISKDARVLAVGEPGEDELERINALTRRALGADEVYTFALRLCDNDIDRDFERFDDGTLDPEKRWLNPAERAPSSSSTLLCSRVFPSRLTL